MSGRRFISTFRLIVASDAISNPRSQSSLRLPPPVPSPLTDGSASSARIFSVSLGKCFRRIEGTTWPLTSGSSITDQYGSAICPSLPSARSASCSPFSNATRYARCHPGKVSWRCSQYEYMRSLPLPGQPW